MKPKWADDVGYRELPDGEAMVIAADGSRALVLNSVGAAVWHLIDGQRSVEEISEFICTQFESLTRDRVTEDVTKLLTDLENAGLICCDTAG